jgi:DUF2075 family protein
LVDGSPTIWRDEENFTVRVADSPRQLEKLVFSGAPDDDARLLAGFCWDWKRWPDHATGINDVQFDIDIDGWKKHWNLRASIDGYPRDSGWAHDPRGSAQVGSVFTAQGFEFDRVGVIIGPDLVWDAASGRMAVNSEASRYAELVRLVRNSPEEEVRIRNQYRVLFTRAMRGIVVYSTDPETLAMLSRIVNPA